MKRLVELGLFSLMLLAAVGLGTEPEKNVPWRAQAEIARRGKMVERVDGYQDAGNPVDAISNVLRVAGKRRVEIELPHGDPAVLDHLKENCLEPFEQRFGLRAPVRATRSF